MRLVVASASPRRRELLEALGLVFDVAPAGIDEAAVAGERAPAHAVVAVAEAKVAAVPRSDALVLAADTVVVVDGAVLGKPESDADARRMLALLRDRTHQVYTGVCLETPHGSRTAVVESQVRLRAYAPAEIAAYVRMGGGLDKAGAYGIQDEEFRPVEEITGCWCNVMGLPLWTAWAMLTAAGVCAPQAPDRVFARCASCPQRPEAR
jgi:septum formation protein